MATKSIFIVDAFQIDQQGVYSHMSGYPKSFDSDSYEGNVDKAKKRATGAFAAEWSAACNVDNYQMKLITLTDIYGLQIRKEIVGKITEPAPTPEPEGEDE